jgi:hypothetical protein
MTIVNPTTTLALERQVTGTNNNTWNDRYSANWARIDAASGGVLVDMTAADVTLTSTDSGDFAADAQTRYAIIVATGTAMVTRTITWPSGLPIRLYYLYNASASPVVFTVSGGTGLTLASHTAQLAFYNTASLVAA